MSVVAAENANAGPAGNFGPALRHSIAYALCQAA